jgi:hypothetical protein
VLAPDCGACGAAVIPRLPQFGDRRVVYLGGKANVARSALDDNA